ncbi:SDR family NAD(P)-dependent oxidoreductase [Microbacterium hominis]|uniref:SDR family NAD(P)-dependent oxidoreductase n=1 Tax=Microbacterium hominis TaxID=162426 RepID=UPI0021E06FA6|nr:SDR family oxidoreductase [Microbacterium hominis]
MPRPPRPPPWARTPAPRAWTSPTRRPWPPGSPSWRPRGGRRTSSSRTRASSCSGRTPPAADLELDVWRRTLDVNLTGTFLTVKHAVRSMLPRGGGAIILTGSPTAVNGEGRDFTAYSASKAAIHGLGRTVAAAYADRGIRVNTVQPAYTETPLVAAITDDPQARAAIVGRIPIGRAGTPDDVAGIMVYLASDDGAFATGAVFQVDGGMTSL